MLLGILILIYGLMLLTEMVFPIIDFSIITYFSITILMCGVYNLAKNERVNIFNIVVCVIGLIFTLISLDILPIGLIKIIFPVLIISLGVVIIYNTSTFKKPYNVNSNKSKTYNSIFSDINQKIEGKINDNVETYSVFGSMKLDLTDIDLDDECNIVVYTIFGETIVKVSDKYNIDYTSTSILGDNVKSLNTNEKKNKKTVHINFITIFGGAKLILDDNNKSD